MANDYMDEADDQQDAVRGDPATEEASDASEDEGHEPVVIPTSACPGMDVKPGMRMVFVVDRVFEDEFTAHYVRSGKASASEPTDESAALME